MPTPAEFRRMILHFGSIEQATIVACFNYYMRARKVIFCKRDA